jgi:hypothetical protein
MDGKLRKSLVFALALCAAAVLLCISAAATKMPAFRLDMDSLNLQKGISANIIVSLENAPGAEIVGIEGIENFDVLSQSKSTITGNINNITTYQENITYIIMPRAAGQFMLKAYIAYNGQLYETNALQATVGENGGKTAPDLFISTVVSHTQSYLGEKIIVTYELYSRYNIYDFGFLDNFAIDGAVAKDIPANRLKHDYVYLDGEGYAMFEVKQLIVDPIKAGGYVIPSFNFQVNVQTSGGSFRSSTPVYLQTESKEFTVIPLPSEGKPANFSGIVGELQLNSRYSREEVDYGDSLVLYVTASGDCNLDNLKNIAGAIPGFSVYETQKNTEESVENGEYRIQKAFEAILVPEKTGKLDISPILISYFNPVTEKYETAEIPGAAITVLGEMPRPNSGGDFFAGFEPVIISQVRYTDPDDAYFTLQMKKQTVFIILLGIGVLAVVAFVLVRLALTAKKQDPAASLYRQLMGKKDAREIYNIFSSMIRHSYNLSLKASSKDNIISRLPDENLASRVADIMDYMESPEALEASGYTLLRDKIKDIYRIIRKTGRGRALS